MTTYSLRLLIPSLATLASVSAQAHDGHGLLGSHWHATDALGFIGIALLVVAAIWWTRK